MEILIRSRGFHLERCAIINDFVLAATRDMVSGYQRICTSGCRQTVKRTW